jgi:signal transduction histidine kinase
VYADPGSRADQDPPWSRPRRGRLFLPLLVAAAQLIGAGIAASEPDARPLTSVAYALLLLGPAALVLRRRFPLVTLVVALGATVGYAAYDFPHGPFFLAAVVALFSAAQRVRRELVWSAVGLAYVGYVAATATGVSGRPAPSLGTYPVVAVFSALAVALAEGARIRSEHFREMRRARAVAAQARQEQTLRQASDERLRIAQELHDVLGHHLSLINVRAGVGLHLLDNRPEEARRALEAIKVASAEALREVRGVLAALHPPDGAAPRAPAQGLADLDELAAQAVAADLPVTVLRSGTVHAVPAEVDRAAYRIVQEALTNVRRHAGPGASATVRVGYGDGVLTLQITDDGAGPTPSPLDNPGNGIPGMRERAAALGGSLAAGPRAAGGFQVDATLPMSGTTGEAL